MFHMDLEFHQPLSKFYLIQLSDITSGFLYPCSHTLRQLGLLPLARGYFHSLLGFAFEVHVKSKAGSRQEDMPMQRR